MGRRHHERHCVGEARGGGGGGGGGGAEEGVFGDVSVATVASFLALTPPPPPPPLVVLWLDVGDDWRGHVYPDVGFVPAGDVAEESPEHRRDQLVATGPRHGGARPLP